jgi:hypothetical protein
MRLLLIQRARVTMGAGAMKRYDFLAGQLTQDQAAGDDF